jgi:hypothetical protein
VWTMRSWVRLVVLVVLSGALVGALAVPALGLQPDPPPPSAQPRASNQGIIDQLRDELARRLKQLRAAQERAATPAAPSGSADSPDQPEHSVTYYAWMVVSTALDLREETPDPDEKSAAIRVEQEAQLAELKDQLSRAMTELPEGERAARVEDLASQIEQHPAATDNDRDEAAAAREAVKDTGSSTEPETSADDEQPNTETAAPESQPAPDAAKNRADLGLSGTDQEQHGEGLEWLDGTIVDQPGSVVDPNGGVVGGQWNPGGTGDEQEDPTQLEAIGGAVGAGTDNRGFNPFGDLFSEQFTTPNPDLGPGILVTPKPDVDLGPGILVTPQPPLGPDQEILVPPELELGGGPGEEIWLPPELGPDREILLPPHDLPGVTDRVALAA